VKTLSSAQNPSSTSITRSFGLAKTLREKLRGRGGGTRCMAGDSWTSVVVSRSGRKSDYVIT
jgi:hypothetical protein